MDNLKESAYHSIKDKILSCDFMPGQKLNEKQLIDELGIGRTPVREALLRLQQEEMVTIIPRSGTYVNPILADEINNLYQLRKIIEPEAAFLASGKINGIQLLDYCDRFKELCAGSANENYLEANALDVEFHRYIVDQTKNNLLIDIFANLMEKVYRMGIYNTKQMKNNPLETTYTEHLDISQAIITGDQEQIRKACLKHINHSLIASLTALR